MNIREMFNDAVSQIPYVGEALTTEINPKGLAMAALAATIALTPVPTKAGGSVEVMAGHNQTTIDTKISTEIAPKANLFIRQITTADYEGEVGFFGLADVSYNIFDGLDVVAEVQAAPGMGVIPRAGLQYFGQLGDFSVYVLGTVKTMENPDGEFVVNLGYTPKISDNVNLLLNLEDLTSVGEKGHNFSVEKLRTGVTFMEKYQVGAALDLTILGNEGELDYNLGGFMGLTF